MSGLSSPAASKMSTTVLDTSGDVPFFIGALVERARLRQPKEQERERARSESATLQQRRLREHTTDKEIFRMLVLRFGHELINAKNVEIAAVWDEVKPVYAHGAKAVRAGDPRPAPKLELRGTTVSFTNINAAGMSSSERGRSFVGPPLSP